MNANERIESALQARFLLFTLFRSLFGQAPSQGQLEQADPDLIEEAFDVVGASCGALMAQALREAREMPVEELLGIHTRTLLGPGKLPSDPWESVHLSGEATLFQGSTMDVRNAYRAQGLLPELYPRVADDHIALECAFLAELAARARELYKSGDFNGAARAMQASRDFQESHLARWAGSYASGLDGAEGCAPYDAYARALAALVDAPVPLA